MLNARWLPLIVLVPSIGAQVPGEISCCRPSSVLSSCGAAPSSMTAACTTDGATSVKRYQSSSVGDDSEPENVLPSVIVVGTPDSDGLLGSAFSNVCTPPGAYAIRSRL